MSNNRELVISINNNVLNHLGINLYSSVPPVLSEVIANSFDADAENVYISVDSTNNIVTIKDDGVGMSRDEVIDKYLTVGYRKRESGSNKSPIKGRNVMGRKGIGKLAVFSIANKVTIHTLKDGFTPVSFTINLHDLRKSINHGEEYKPTEENMEQSHAFKTGTTLIISDFKKPNAIKYLGTVLKKALAKRFTIFGTSAETSDQFNLFINDELIKVSDRHLYKEAEYVWTYGVINKEVFNASQVQANRESIIDGENKYKISGWIGLAKTSSSLKEGDNIISIVIRGKVAQEDIISEIKEDRLTSSYLFGEINADFLDDDDNDDIATSSREKINQDDSRYLVLKDFIAAEIKYILSQRARLKEDAAKVETTAILPSLNKWFENLKGDDLKHAKKIFGKVNSVTTDKMLRVSLYKSAVLSFEKFKLDKTLSIFEKLTEINLETILPIIGSLDSFESLAYYQITSQRLGVIKTLEKYVDNNELEKIVQKHLFNHLWLLDPHWDRATTNAEMEKILKKIAGTNKEKSKSGRIDITYKSPGGKHVIIELKRPDRSCTKHELLEQVDKYRVGFTKEVNRTSTNLRINDANKDITVYVLIGDMTKFVNDLDFFERNYVNVLTYKDLIENAKKMYSEYLDDESKHNERIKLMNEIFDSNDEIDE